MPTRKRKKLRVGTKALYLDSDIISGKISDIKEKLTKVEQDVYNQYPEVILGSLEICTEYDFDRTIDYYLEAEIYETDKEMYAREARNKKSKIAAKKRKISQEQAKKQRELKLLKTLTKKYASEIKNEEA